MFKADVGIHQQAVYNNVYMYVYNIHNINMFQADVGIHQQAVYNNEVVNHQPLTYILTKFRKKYQKTKKNPSTPPPLPALPLSGNFKRNVTNEEFKICRKNYDTCYQNNKII